MNISCIVATYNRPRYLRRSIASFAASVVLPLEVLIADDGSTAETIEVVKELQERFQQAFPVVHVRQEHDGIRKQRVVNEAVRRSTGDYLFFTDGDCLVHRLCLKAHLERNDPHAILAGQSVQVGQELTERILADESVLKSLRARLLVDFIARRSHHAKEAFILRSGILRNLLQRDRIKSATSVIGRNFSIYKKLFLDINGYDEDFWAFGDEDADLGIRVINSGGFIRSVRNMAIVYHLYHPGTWDMNTEHFKFNAMIKQRRIENKEQRCKNGIIKYTDEDLFPPAQFTAQ
ncbi:MAG TPA: glycosyltransferase [Nitrospirota bacterium]|nr:glycosyltransferase [Nitrospirota bacterium]